MSYRLFGRIFCVSCLQYHHYQSLGSTHVKGMRLNNLFLIIVVVFLRKTPQKWSKWPYFDQKWPFLTIILTFFNLVLFDIYNTDQMCFTEYFLIHRAPFYSVLCPRISYMTGPLMILMTRRRNWKSNVKAKIKYPKKSLFWWETSLNCPNPTKEQSLL